MFLDAGYSPSLFDELSIGEVNDMLESYARSKERETKQREAVLKDEIVTLFNQALQIGNIVGKLMDKDTQIRLPKDYYPELFNKEAEETDFTKQEEAGDKPKLSPEMELHKARMDDYIFRHNMAIKEAKERGESSGRNDLGETASNHRGSNESLL